MKERHIEHALTTAVTASGGLCWKFTSPGTTGVPDRICIYHGQVIFVEVKAPGKKPRPIQHHRIGQLAAHHIPTIIVDSPDRIQEVLDALSAA